MGQRWDKIYKPFCKLLACMELSVVRGISIFVGHVA